MKNYLNTSRIAIARKSMDVNKLEDLMNRETFYRMGIYVLEMAIEEGLVEMEEVPSSFIIALSRVEFKLNGRLSKTLGRYQYFPNNGKILPVRIELSKKLAKYGTFDEVVSVALHEMAHLVLSLYRKDGQFGDGDVPFELLLKALGASSTQVKDVDFPRHTYKCKCAIHTMNRRARRVSYSCSICDGILEYLGEHTLNERKKLEQALRTV